MKTKGDWEIRFVWASTNIRWYSNTKADKYSSFYNFFSLLDETIYFHETD